MLHRARTTHRAGPGTHARKHTKGRHEHDTHASHRGTASTQERRGEERRVGEEGSSRDLPATSLLSNTVNPEMQPNFKVYPEGL